MKLMLTFLTNLFLLACCVEKTGYDKYEDMVEDGLATRQRSDSLFFNLHFGMSSKQFYSVCWEMNKKGLLTDGIGNTAVLYKMKDELKYPASMNFYPNFHESKVFKMGVSFQYDGWSPWNRNMSSDSLQQDVLRLYKEWYKEGNEFLKLVDEERGVIYVKVDNNRRIIIGKFDESHVKVDYTDLIVESQLKK